MQLERNHGHKGGRAIIEDTPAHGAGAECWGSHSFPESQSRPHPWGPLPAHRTAQGGPAWQPREAELFIQPAPFSWGLKSHSRIHSL